MAPAVYGLKELPQVAPAAVPEYTGPSYTFAEPVHGSIDGEEFMGTGTAFDTDEAPPVYTPPN